MFGCLMCPAPCKRDLDVRLRIRTMVMCRSSPARHLRPSSRVTPESSAAQLSDAGFKTRHKGLLPKQSSGVPAASRLVADDVKGLADAAKRGESSPTSNKGNVMRQAEMLRDLGIKTGKAIPASVLDRPTSEDDLILVGNPVALATSSTPHLPAEVMPGTTVAGSTDA